MSWSKECKKINAGEKGQRKKKSGVEGGKKRSGSKKEGRKVNEYKI